MPLWVKILFLGRDEHAVCNTTQHQEVSGSDVITLLTSSVKYFN